MNTMSFTRFVSATSNTRLATCIAIALAAAAPPVAADPARDSAAGEPFTTVSMTPVMLGSPSAQRLPSAQAWMRRVAGVASAAPAASIVVTNCDDAGPGSLRQAVLDAVSGDTVDLSQAGCSVITLTTGEIAVDIDELTLQGPGAPLLTVSGGDLYRIFRHSGTGTLNIDDLTLSHGNAYVPVNESGNPHGGCVMSMGSVNIARSIIDSCQATNFTPYTDIKGGGLYVLGGGSIVDSAITGNLVQSTSAYSVGGGVYSAGPLSITRTFIASNQTLPGHRGVGGGVAVGAFVGGQTTLVLDRSEVSSNISSYGGGAFVNGQATITSSTLMTNGALWGGGFYSYGSAAAITIENSTISGNEASLKGGGAYIYGAARIYNSTIANNVVHSATNSGGGIAVAGSDIELESSLVAGNKDDGGDNAVPDDLMAHGTPSVTGSNNLVFATTLNLPVDTLIGIDPLLMPLADNGGPTLTMALSAGSPAIDGGNNIGEFAFDQRGFARTIGAATDMGAVEYGSTDTIFADGFDEG